MALLSFCLMGNVAFAQSEKIGNFTYDTIEEDGVVYAYFTGYTGPAISELVFPEIPIQDAVKYVDEDFARNVADDITASVTKLDLTNVDELYSLTYTSARKTKGFVNVTEITIGGDIFVAEDANYKVSTISFAEGVSAITTSLSPFKSTLNKVNLTGITYIGKEAFSGCSGLTGVLNLSGVELGEGAFAGTGYSTIVVSNISQLPARVFKNCSNLTTVVMDGVTSIGDEAFMYCPLNNDMELASVQTIGASAFMYTNLKDKTLQFASCLTSIGVNAFANTNIAGANFYSDPAGVNSAFAGADVLTLYIENDQLFTSGNTYDNVVYIRSKNGNYGAIVLPFDFAKGNNTYYEFTHFDGGMHFSEVESPKANIPYLYKGNETKFNGTSYTTGTLSDVAIAKGAEWISHGVYSDHTNNPITEGSYKWAVSGGELKWFESLKIKPYRAYWACTSSNSGVADAKIFIHGRNGETTSINMTEVDGLENMVPVYYDLTGRRVLEPQSGNLYIVNGKKVIF